MYEFTREVSERHVDVIHGFLTGSYWARGVDRATVCRSVAASRCYGIVSGGHLVAFGRVVTDLATVAYLADVFVLDAHRGRGLGKRLVGRVLDDEALGSVRRWVLRTEDAHALYARYGFRSLAAPRTWMERTGAPWEKTKGGDA